MRYLSEIGAAWRPLLAATLGMGTGMSIIGTVTSAIAPSLIADAGWSKAQFAMTGMLGMLTALSMPFIGRLADLFGVKLTALIGIVAMPLTMLGFSLIGGSFEAYLGIFIFQSIICVTTTATVYTRLVVQHVEHARGLALAIVACGPALFAAIGGPVINEFVEAHGWAATYRMLALFTTLAGIAVFLLIPAGRAHAALVTAPRRRAREDYPEIFREKAFWLLFGAMYLCNLPLTLILVQLKMLVLDQGISGEGASIMFTALAVGMLLGRFVTGVALDRFAPQVVSFVMLALPGLGLFVLASSWDAPMVVTAAIFSLGFAVGAEGDILAFLVARHFRTGIYSSVLGLLTGVCSLAAASGAALLSWTLARTGSFDSFLLTVGTSVVAGALLLLMLRKEPQTEEALPEPQPEPLSKPLPA
ncbi:MFS transporter [Novosphingobium guangzhouense]|uniref:Sugar phosphate permease n=1 Tax=Novosphingobium guangzhouense TaxID=1850347 RepID=A0A2K2FT08_9SPHN|nr:MFS transporter [Novosphingobium guangzhouense]PNU01916.1 sugar phosphate permease [Novosphingobium guangzhouense]